MIFWNMCAITPPSRVCMLAIKTSSRRCLKYVYYHDAVEIMCVSHPEVVKMASEICVLSRYSQDYSFEVSQCRQDGV